MSASSSFQDAKDTFYVTLRDRLAALNPDRTVVVRGSTRPGMLVRENEAADGSLATAGDAFVLCWTGFCASVDADASEATALQRGRCEIRYGTRGMPEVGGMDRGRTLQAMDEELAAVLQPATAPLLSYAGTGAGSDAGTPRTGTTLVFWSDATYSDATATADRVERTVTVDVFAWKEER